MYLLWSFPHYYTHNLKKEESGFSKTRVPIYQSTGRNDLEFKISQIKYVGVLAVSYTNSNIWGS